MKEYTSFHYKMETLLLTVPWDLQGDFFIGEGLTVRFANLKNGSKVLMD
jgi:hypothetical protein